jgi:uncharacterized protein YdhG (YjbR/CyaY superfamily)
MTMSGIDEYIASFPAEVQAVLAEIRRRILMAVPGAAETISYRIPAMTLNGRHLIYFAAWRHHISVYPVPAGDQAFRGDIEPYRYGKGTVRFPLSQPVPYHLIEQMAVLLARRQGQGPRPETV